MFLIKKEKCRESGWEVYRLCRSAPGLDVSIHEKLHEVDGGSKKVYMRVGVGVMEELQDENV